MKLEFCLQIFEKSSNIKFHEIYSVGAELLHVDGRTNMTKLIVAFRNFAILFREPPFSIKDSGRTVVKALCYKSEGCWFDPSWCHWIFQ